MANYGLTKICSLVLGLLFLAVGGNGWAMDEKVYDPNDLEIVTTKQKVFNEHRVQVRSTGEMVCELTENDFYFLSYKLDRAIKKNVDVVLGHGHQTNQCLMLTFEFEPKKNCSP